MKALVFPGQGAQHKGMGKGLFEAYPHLVAQADEILGYSIEQLCLQDPDKNLILTQYTQPALYIVSALSFLRWSEANTNEVAYFAGHSLGEYSALFAAGVLSFADGLKLVKKRGELMGCAPQGAMAAVINCDLATIERILKEQGKTGVDVANFNSSVQTVISGTTEDITDLKVPFKASKVMYIPLNVNSAFHSRYMMPVVAAFSDYMRHFDFSPARGKCISNVTARPYQQVDYQRLLGQQIVGSVDWLGTIQYLIAQGVTEFEEIGPGNVLTRLIEDIEKNTDVDACKAILLKEQQEKEGYSIKVKSQATAPVETQSIRINPIAMNFGSARFRQDYNAKYTYVAGSTGGTMTSTGQVVRMAKAGYLSFLGSELTNSRALTEQLVDIQRQLADIESPAAFGVSLHSNMYDESREAEVIDSCIAHQVAVIEALNYLRLSLPLVRYRLSGLKLDESGKLVVAHKVMAKVASKSCAEMFLCPAPKYLVELLLDRKEVTVEQAKLAEQVAMADDICVESVVAQTPMDMTCRASAVPAIKLLRDKICAELGSKIPVRVGTSGGIGTPHAAAASYVLGAEFIVTNTVNQCTVESDLNDCFKALLVDVDVYDCALLPGFGLSDSDTAIPVLKKGQLYPARMIRLMSIYDKYTCWLDVPLSVREDIEHQYFGCDFDKAYQNSMKGQSNSYCTDKVKMAKVFTWYGHQALLAGKISSINDGENVQILCSPALGAFNQWTENTELSQWQNRHVDTVAAAIINGAVAAIESMSLQLNK